jgi:hypothetical protein
MLILLPQAVRAVLMLELVVGVAQGVLYLILLHLQAIMEPQALEDKVAGVVVLVVQLLVLAVQAAQAV